MRFSRLEDQGSELMQIVSPVGPCVKAAALVLLHIDTGVIQDGNRGMAILERDVVLAVHPPRTGETACPTRGTAPRPCPALL